MLSRPRNTESWEAVEHGSTLQKTARFATKLPTKMSKLQRSIQIKELMKNTKSITAAGMAVGILVAAGTVSGDEMKFRMKEHLGLKYGRELISVPVSAAQGDSLSVAGPRGPVPGQLSASGLSSGQEKSDRAVKAVFVIDGLAPRADETYALKYGKEKAPEIKADLSVAEGDGTVEIISSGVGVRLPLGEKKLDVPQAPEKIPGPMLAMRLGNGAWGGSSNLAGDAAVKSWASRITDRGPVFTRVELEYVFTDDSTLALAAELVAGDNSVRWDMQVSDDRPNLAVSFVLPPIPGVKQVDYPRGYGQWAYSSAKTGKRTLPISPGDKPFCQLCPDSSVVNCFPENAVSIVLAPEGGGASLQIRSHESGLWADPVAPFTYGGFKNWDLNMIVKSWQNWQRKRIPVSYASDGTVTMNAALTKGRRIWSVGTGEPAVGRYLDKIKDHVLEWPYDSKRPHPCLFMDAAEVKTAIARAESDPGMKKEQARGEFAWAWNAFAMPSAIGLPQKPADQQSPEEKAKVIGALRKQLSFLGEFDVMRGAIGLAGLYDALIDSTLVAPDEKPLLRAQMAEFAYVLADPKCWSPERGYHSGNPNMSCSYILSLGIIACAISDHPKAKTWTDYASGWMDRWLDSEVGPNGEWIPEGSHYSTVSIDVMLAYAIAAKRAGFKDFTNDPRLKKMLLYYAKTQTPRDPQRGNFRASGAWGRGTSGDAMPLFAMAAIMSAKSDPDFSQTMQWIWSAEGFPPGGADWRMGGYEPYAFDPKLPAKTPAWNSELFPNLGVFCRSAFETPYESYIILLSHTDSLRNLDVWTPGIGGISQWFGRGKPLSTCFNMDTGYAVRHELLRDGVRLARNWGAPEDPKMPFGHYTTTAPQAVALQSAADYVRSTFAYTKVDDRDWFPNPPPPAYPRVAPAKEPKLEWTRQMLFMKDADPAGPAYIVLRDTTRGGQPTSWQFWSLSEKIGTPEQVKDLAAFLADKPGDKHMPARELPAGTRYTAVGQFDMDVEYFIVSPADTPRHTLRYGGPDNRRVPQLQDLMHLQMPGDGAYYLVLFPRPRGEAAPAFSAISDGKIIKISGAFGTDYAFLAMDESAAAAEDFSAKGTSAALQIRGPKTRLVLGNSGDLRWKEYGITAKFAATLQISADELLVSLPAVSEGGTLTITAPAGWKLKSPPEGVKLESKDGALLLTIPKGTANITLLKQ